MTTCFLLRHLGCSHSVSDSERRAAERKERELDGKRAAPLARRRPGCLSCFIISCSTVNGAVDTEATVLEHAAGVPGWEENETARQTS